MTDAECLDKVVATTRHTRYRELLDPAHPDFNPAYWPIVRAMATGEYPPIATQAGNLLGAIGRSVSAVMSGETLKVDQAEHDRRMAICQACEHLDSAQNRCRKCACFLAVKPWLKAESCPIEKW